MADTETSADTEPHAPAEHGKGPSHPTELQYIKIALLLGAITAAEVAVYYVPSLEGLLVPILLVMAITKFTLVVMWFMHLRFDNKLFRRFFVAGILLALFCFGIVLTTFHVFSR